MIEEINLLKNDADKLLLQYDEENSERDELDEEFFDLELKVLEIGDYQFNDTEFKQYKTLKKLIEKIRKDNDIFDEEAERNSMFPNGEDED